MEKNSYPISLNKNNYNDNKKNNVITTPLWLVQNIMNILPWYYENANVIDICCNSGCLSSLFKSNVFGIDIIKPKNTAVENSKFYCLDFLGLKSFKLNKRIDLLVCNPPFNDMNGKYKRKLLPELFFRKIIELFGPSIPFVLFVPMGFLKNQRVNSKRYKFIRDSGVEITSILSLPIDAFEGVLFHSEVLFFNIPGMNPHYFIDKDL